MTPKQVKRALRINSCQQPLAAVLPLLNELLGSKEFVAGLARQGVAVDTDMVTALQREFIETTHDLAVEYRKGATMEKNGEVLDGKQFLAVVKQAYKDSKMPSITQWAVKLGVSYQFLSHVLRGDYNPGPAIAKALGYEQVYGFRRKAETPATNLKRALKSIDRLKNGASRRATKPAATRTNRHHGKKAQSKKK